MNVTEKKEIKEALEQYLTYLRIGAFKNISYEKDIEICENIITFA